MIYISQKQPQTKHKIGEPLTRANRDWFSSTQGPPQINLALPGNNRANGEAHCTSK
jgi:hypothetical protein